MKWSFLAFIPKQTRRRRWTPCLIFLLEAPEWLAAGLNTGSSDKKNMESRQVNTRSKWLSSNLRDWIRSNWSRQDQLAENCPVSVQADLRQLYSSVCELIRWWLYYFNVDTSSLTMINSIHYLRHGLFLHRRHFWDAFPPTTPELAEKAKKMFETLQKFQSVKVRPFETEVERR